MKKLLLSLSSVIAFHFANSQCNELFISEYVEGYNNNKALEIYNPKSTAVNLSSYRLIRWSNGSSTSDADINYVQSLTGTIQPKSTFTCFLDKRVVGATGADTILEASLLTIANNMVTAGTGAFYSPNYNANVEGAKMMPFNGDDALSLQSSAGGWHNVDIFAKIGEQPTNGSGTTNPTGAWTDTPPYNDGQGAYLTQNKTLVRKASVNAGVTVNPTLFDALAEYDSLSVGTYSNLGTHTCVCALNVKENSSNGSIAIFPNPNNGRFNVSSFSNGENFQIENIEIVNLLGETIYTSKYPFGQKGWITLDSNLPKGIYLLKAKGTEKVVFEKVILQ